MEPEGTCKRSARVNEIKQNSRWMYGARCKGDAACDSKCTPHHSSITASRAHKRSHRLRRRSLPSSSEVTRMRCRSSVRSISTIVTVSAHSVTAARTLDLVLGGASVVVSHRLCSHSARPTDGYRCHRVRRPRVGTRRRHPVAGSYLRHLSTEWPENTISLLVVQARWTAVELRPSITSSSLTTNQEFKCHTRQLPMLVCMQYRDSCVRTHREGRRYVSGERTIGPAAVGGCWGTHQRRHE